MVINRGVRRPLCVAARTPSAPTPSRKQRSHQQHVQHHDTCRLAFIGQRTMPPSKTHQSFTPWSSMLQPINHSRLAAKPPPTTHILQRLCRQCQSISVLLVQGPQGATQQRQASAAAHCAPFALKGAVAKGGYPRLQQALFEQRQEDRGGCGGGWADVLGDGAVWGCGLMLSCCHCCHWCLFRPCCYNLARDSNPSAPPPFPPAAACKSAAIW